LNIGYAELGPPRGRPVVLHHGWPYDIHSYADVAPLLASGGYRTIVPYLRGYGTTRFLSPDTFRNGQQAALAADIVALMDVLAIDKAIRRPSPPADPLHGLKPRYRRSASLVGSAFNARLNRVGEALPFHGAAKAERFARRRGPCLRTRRVRFAARIRSTDRNVATSR